MNRYILLLITLLAISCKQEISRDIAKTEVIDREKFQQILNQETSDKVLIVNFWATWCAPCVEELPDFEKISRNYADDVDMVLISLDEAANVEKLVDPFLEKNSITATVKLLDDPYAAEWIPLVDPHWDGAIPVTLIKYQGNKRFYNRTFTYAELEEEINKLL
jgi:thiol-disulfide isomerase/thioredoxin